MYQLNLIQNTSGTFSFVGSVPYNLGWVTKAGNIVTLEEVESQLRLPSNYRTIKNRSVASEYDAWNEATRLGYTTKGAK